MLEATPSCNSRRKKQENANNNGLIRHFIHCAEVLFSRKREHGPFHVYTFFYRFPLLRTYFLNDLLVFAVVALLPDYRWRHDDSDA